MTMHDKIEWIRHAMIEALSGDSGSLEQALRFAEQLSRITSSIQYSYALITGVIEANDEERTSQKDWKTLHTARMCGSETNNCPICVADCLK